MSDVVLDKALTAISRYSMLAPGARVVAAVSGGADSVCLFHVLRELAPRVGFAVAGIAHLNHKLRGEASDGDERFVAELAARWGVEFFCESNDVAAAGGNLEEAARLARREFFARVMREHGVDRVATGHTRDDQAETVLFRMLRGSGLAGLAGILPATREGLMRPLLDVSRAEIEEFLRGRGIAWREDASNRDEGFARNRIRHSLLPQLAREWNPEIATALARLADTAHEEERWWWDRIERLAEQVLVEEAGGLEIEAGRLARMPRATSRRLVRCAVARSGAGPRPAADPLVGLVGRGKSRTGGSGADEGVRPTQADQAGATNLDFDAVERVLELAAAQAGSGTLDLGGGVRVMRSFDRMRFVNAGSGALPEPVAVTIPGRHEWNGTRVCLDVADAAPESAGCVRLKVTEGASAAPLMLRGWRAGDHYHPAGHLRDQNIKEMFQQARVPSWQRGFWPILCQGTEILWARQFGAAAERAACSSEPAVWVWEEKVSKA